VGGREKGKKKGDEVLHKNSDWKLGTGGWHL
jgi:hypothetical protein